MPVPAFTSVEEALGFMYVVEGATLGGAYILKALSRNANILAAVNEFNYYGVYGDLIGPRWKNFQAVLLANVASTTQEDTCIEAAKKAFDGFRDVFKATVATV
jgi:heme oxygenase